MQKICVKVAFKYLDNQSASDAEIVSNVRVTKGCFIDGSAGMYKTTTLEQLKNGEY